jgi:hypothetical protein
MRGALLFSRPYGTLLLFPYSFPSTEVLGYFQSPLAGLKIG